MAFFKKHFQLALVLVYYFGLSQSAASFENITFKDYLWLNEPRKWSMVNNNLLEMTTENRTDFWQQTYYNFSHNSGHFFGVELREDFTYTVCIEANFTTLYDQAGLMVYVDERHWLKAGIEYNDGQPMVGSVLTQEMSDWATGVFTGNPRKFWLRLTRAGPVLCIKYSTDNLTWLLLRLSPFPRTKVFVGPMACSPQRDGLGVRFSGINISEPADDILHGN